MKGRTAIVTGSASGIGKATALCLAREGANVVIADINEDDAKGVGDLARQHGVQALVQRVDVSDAEQIRSLVEETVRQFGTVDILVNNAADLGLLENDLDVVETSFEVLDKTYASNFRGAFAACKYALPHMLTSGRGAIVNVSSIQSTLGDYDKAAYSMMKAAINSLTQCIATRFGREGIRCNAVSPGPVMNREAGKEWPEAMRVGYLEHVTTPDIGAPAELGEVITFLASDRASYINGAVIPVDGGYSAHMHLDTREIYA